ncbi:MAG: EAL domain-containing protein [Burkholderiales bacterium]|nr:EAL domain-containing protein [Burkholderiales bacterium]
MRFYSLEQRCEILAAISQAPDLSVLLDVLGNEIDKLGLLDGYMINLHDAGSDYLISLKMRFPGEYRYLEKTYHGYKTSVKGESTNLNIIAFNKRSVVRVDDQDASRSQAMSRWDLKDCAAMPIVDRAADDPSPVGTIMLMLQNGRIEEGAFDILTELSSLFATPLRAALETALLKEFRERFAAEASEHERALQFIIDINNLTAPEKIFSMFAAELFRQIPFECLGFFLHEGKGLNNKMVVCSDESFQSVQEEWSSYLSDKTYELKHIAGGVSHAFLKNSSLLFHDAMEILHMPMSELDKATMRILKTPRTLLVLPIRYQNKAIGSIAFFSISKVVEVSESDLRLLEKLSSFLGTAITNSKNFELAQAQNAELERLASHDVLTGLPNRSLLMDRLTRGLSRWERLQQKATIAFVDLDHFKNINDTLGHSAGDRVLVETSSRLISSLRQSDTVARFGGDEFVLILENPNDGNAHMLVLQRLLETLCEPIPDLAQEVSLTCSIGFARYPDDGTDADTLLNAADAAMYLAKQLGRSNIQAYTPDMRSQARDRMTIESKLRVAVDNDELLLQYQPKLDLRSGRIVGVEALVRWQHPEMGVVSPGVFIPIAEESGLIIPIGDWILRTACAQGAAWQAAGIPIPIAVNLSARQFLQPDIAQRVKYAIDSSGIDPRYLELEITESMSMGNPEQSIGIMQTFRDLGITLTIDDFGTGYSNLSYLKRFPVDKIKLDQSFVREITQSSEALAISQAILAIAHSLHLKVVAEGVETEAQLTLLSRNQCEEAQGYYISRPLSAQPCAAFIREDRRFDIEKLMQLDSSHTVLIVDVQGDQADSLAAMLSASGYRVLSVENAEAGFEMLATNPSVTTVIADHHLSGMRGLDFLANIKRMYPDVVRVLAGKYTEVNHLLDVMNRNIVFKFLQKPWESEAVRSVMMECCMEYERRAARTKNVFLSKQA